MTKSSLDDRVDYPEGKVTGLTHVFAVTISALHQRNPGAIRGLADGFGKVGDSIASAPEGERPLFTRGFQSAIDDVRTALLNKVPD